MTIKMIFSDIDGTLLNSNHQISPGTRNAVRKCSEKQIPFILVSARMPGAIMSLQKELDIHAPIVSYGGALVFRNPDIENPDRPIRNIHLDPELVRDIYQIICKRFPSVCFSAYSLNEWLVPDSENEWVVQEKMITGTPAQAFHFDSSGKDLPPINKILCMGSPSIIDELENFLGKNDTAASIYKSKPTYLEITDRRANKAAALELLINDFQIGREETAAFGDNFNDLEMLRFAGVGIAMGNAPEAIRASANFVTRSNDQDGIVRGLEKFGVI
ncbi:HAD family phosphatase [Sporolactobacillus shoreae]|uniref:HAD family phosphatase n=1 Tax=Sporolactobacillus shoreae TaxID=1465501 RepID=A0A4Z0GPL9_9BACL|nr:Cof-type HAD-IIB family hydrolase [Sporolactobacillus shoreae]TGA99164.1 HAD family phosphatase [Sporolactobacillus shoreae]